MIQKNPFLKYLIKDEKKDVFHSSGYAKAQSGAAMGAASTESFEVRVNVNQNRQRVRGYRDSKIMMDANKNAPKAKAYVPEQEKVEAGAKTGAQGGAKTDNAKNKAVVSNRGKMSDAVVSNRGNITDAVVSNRGKVSDAVISNRGKVGSAVISNRTPVSGRAPQVPMRRMGISIKK